VHVPLTYDGDTHGDFWDPPGPLHRPVSTAHVFFKNGGRFSARGFRDLRYLLDESPFTRLIEGRLLTDSIFFDQALDTIGGPYRGPWGYYLVKVLDRTPPLRPIDPESERHVELLREHWIRLSFVD